MSVAKLENRPMWQPGTQILQQDLWLGQLLISRPVTVVTDRPDYLALYTHPNAPYRTAAMGGGRYQYSLEERVSRMMSTLLPPFVERHSGGPVLTLTPPDSRHSVWLFWTSNWEVKGWFINLQKPVRRISRAVLVEDQVLDIRVEPDGTWQWKDEDEFGMLHQRGFFTDEQAFEIRREAQRLAIVVETKASPFCDGWEQWRPSPSWPTPAIPPDWEVVD